MQENQTKETAVEEQPVKKEKKKSHFSSPMQMRENYTL